MRNGAAVDYENGDASRAAAEWFEQANGPLLVLGVGAVVVVGALAIAGTVVAIVSAVSEE